MLLLGRLYQLIKTCQKLMSTNNLTVNQAEKDAHSSTRGIVVFGLLLFVSMTLFIYWLIPTLIQNFKETQRDIAWSSLKGTQQNITLSIGYKQDEVSLMARENKQRLKNIISFSNQQISTIDYNFINKLVTNRFPKHHSFAITNNKGVITLIKGDVPLGNSCKKAIQQHFLHPESHNSLSIIHSSGTKGFHYDVIATTEMDDSKIGGIFFISFPLDEIVGILANAQLPHQQLILVRRDAPNKIELSASGIRKTDQGKSFLSEENLANKLFAVNVEKSAWTLIVLPEENYIENYERQLWIWAAIGYSLFLVLLIGFSWRLIYEATQRGKAQGLLIKNNENLEKIVNQRTQMLNENRASFQAIIDYATDAMISIGEQGIISRFNPGAERIFGYAADEVIGKNIKLLMNSHNSEHHDEYLQKYLISGEKTIIGTPVEVEGKHKNGMAIKLVISISDTGINGIFRFSGILRDVTAEKTAEQALFNEKERAQTTLQALSDGVITIDLHSTITHVNRSAEKMLKCKSKQAISKHIDSQFLLLNEKTHAVISLDITKIVTLKSHISLMHKNALLKLADGDLISIEYSVVTIQDMQGNISGTVLTFRDVTEARSLQKQLEFDARHDALTGLVNRKEFEYRLHHVLKYNGGKRKSCARSLLFMDLDQFKIVNDTAGHAAGDELLKRISLILQDNVRERDTLARIGGDEFALLLEGCSTDDAVGIANIIIQAIKNFQFPWEGKNFRIGISIGITAIQGDVNSLDEILSQADAACYAAKDAGRNRLHIYSKDNEDLMRRKGEMWWTTEIIRASEENRLVLYQQKIMPINDETEKDLYHYEILIRMLDDDGSLVPPGNFLPAAERYKLMPMIDRWVVEKIFSWLSAHPEHIKKLSKCSINLSGPSMGDEDFHSFLQQAMDKSNIPAEKICWEITETAAISNFAGAQLFIDLMRAKGCKFSLDDFGAGLSSFGYLKNLKVDYLKIDGCFVKDMLNEPKDQLIVESIHNVGTGMHMKTIAEFVENDEILERLKSIGVDYAQGYGVAKPAPLDDLLS